MNKFRTIAGVILICLPTAVFAQATGAAPDVSPVPARHLKHRPTPPPAVPGEASSGVSNRDDPARLDKELQPSTDRAIHSLCSYCLKPEGSRKRR